MDLAAKLQLKSGQKAQCLSVPATMADVLADIVAPAGDGLALLVFVRDQTELAAERDRIVAAAAEDRLTWVAYPKAGQLGTDLNRDSLAADICADGRARPVRQVSLDEVWSALRFRPA